MLKQETLMALCQQKGLSVSAIARRLRCSDNKVNYWLSEFKIPKRSISDALYKKWNPKGDPFSVRAPLSVEDGILYGLGVGLYWGEGTKASKTSIKLGNTDPALVRKFIDFLLKFYGINKKRLRFGLQIFGDMDTNTAVKYWMRSLNVSRGQFYPKIIITPHRGIGNYRRKTRYGVLTVYFNNRKLRDILCNAIDKVAQ